MQATTTGLLLVGHGTRSEQGQREFLETAHWVARALPQVAVEPGYLELASPSIEQGLRSLAERGVQHVVVLPLLLFAAGHAKHDIPQAVAAAAATLPPLSIRQGSHLGCHEHLLALSAQRFYEAIADEVAGSSEETLWLIVGRGSRDAEAIAELHRFVQLRQRLTPVAQVRVAFLAMAEPALVDELARIAALRFRRVVVQPHLLFHGELLATLQAEVVKIAAICPGQAWSVTQHLGPTEPLVIAIVERFIEAQLARQSEILTKP